MMISRLQVDYYVGIVSVIVKLFVDKSYAQQATLTFEKVLNSSSEINALDQPDISSLNGIRSEMRCAAKCTEQGDCVMYNYYPLSHRCEMYSFVPWNYGKLQGCESKRVSTKTYEFEKLDLLNSGSVRSLLEVIERFARDLNMSSPEFGQMLIVSVSECYV